MLHLHSCATSHSPACMHISFYSPTRFGRCIILLFSLYRLRKLRPRETKRLTQWHSFPVFFPQTHCIPSSLPPSYSNLYITNEHLVDLQPEPIHPFPTPSHISAGGSHSTGIIRLDLVQERLEQPLLTLGW